MAAAARTAASEAGGAGRGKKEASRRPFGRPLLRSRRDEGKTRKIRRVVAIETIPMRRE
jgi:hypothetical protein